MCGLVHGESLGTNLDLCHDGGEGGRGGTDGLCLARLRRLAVAGVQMPTDGRHNVTKYSSSSSSGGSSSSSSSNSSSSNSSSTTVG
jgi:hypothetical protein